MTELIKQLEKEVTALIEIQAKAKRHAHNFAKSFVDHPKGCVYCQPRKDK